MTDAVIPAWLFRIALAGNGEIFAQCDNLPALPELLRIIADALEAGEARLDVHTVPWSGPN